MKKHSKQLRKCKPISMKAGIIVLLIAIGAFPIVVTVLICMPSFIMPPTITAKEWLAFWGSYGGGLIGGIGALLSVYFTLRYYREKDIEQQRLLQFTPLLEKINFLQQQLASREIIKDENMLRIDAPSAIKKDIEEYNRLVSHLKGFFTEQAVGTLIGVFQLKDENGELYYSHSTLNYLKLPSEIREYAEIIASLSLYKNCTELLCNDPRLAYIISVEGGGSAGMWPYWWHTQYLQDHEDITNDLSELFIVVEKLDIYFEEEYQKTYTKIYKKQDRKS